MKPRLLLCLSVGLACALPVAAHHSFPAQYDINKPITLTGKVTKVEWTNPHIFIYVDVTDDKGAVVNWAFEMGGPNSLIRQGWKRDSLKPEDTVTIDGSLARDGSHLVNARTVAVDGRKLFAGSTGGDAPAAPQK